MTLSLDSIWIGDGLSTPGAEGIGLDFDVIYRGHRHLSLKMQNVDFFSMSDFLHYCTLGQNVHGNLT